MKGTVEPGSTIIVKADGVILRTAAADSSGKYTLTITQQKAGTSLETTATDKAGNISDSANAVVTNSFTDVVQNQHFQEEIKHLADKNIITGFPDGTFKPSKELIRSDFSAFMARALDDQFKISQ